MLGASFISEDGVPVVYVDYKLEYGDDKKLEAVIILSPARDASFHFNR